MECSLSEQHIPRDWQYRRLASVPFSIVAGVSGLYFRGIALSWALPACQVSSADIRTVHCQLRPHESYSCDSLKLYP
jgi:hypothetical protein